MLNRLIVSNLVVHFVAVCGLIVAGRDRLAARVIVPEGRVMDEPARQKLRLALLQVRQVGHGLRMVLPRGEDRGEARGAHVVMHIDHPLVRVEIVAVDHGLVDRFTGRIHMMMEGAMVVMVATSPASTAAQLDVVRVLPVSATEALMAALQVVRLDEMSLRVVMALMTQLFHVMHEVLVIHVVKRVDEVAFARVLELVLLVGGHDRVDRLLVVHEILLA